MKVLVVTNRIPYPPKDGGAIAMLSMLEGLSSNPAIDLSLASLNTQKHYVNVDKLPDVFSNISKTLYFNINTNITPFGLIANLLSTKSYHISRFYNVEFEKQLIKFIQDINPEIIQFECLAITIYSTKIKLLFPEIKLVYRAHNIEFKIWERLSTQVGVLKKLYLKVQTNRLKKFEINILQSFDAIVPISQIDGVFFIDNGFRNHILTSPTGLKVLNYSDGYSSPKEKNTVFHIGSLDWMPNQEGLRWFITKVWPIVEINNREAIFIIAGKNIPAWIYSFQKESIQVVGEVESSTSFMKDNHVMIVPLFSGSGIRIKILEGMATAKAIVSTSIGAEGIIYENNHNILIADTEQEFANHILKLLSDEKLAENIVRNAYANALINYNQEQITNKIVDFYAQLVKPNITND